MRAAPHRHATCRAMRRLYDPAPVLAPPAGDDRSILGGPHHMTLPYPIDTSRADAALAEAETALAPLTRVRAARAERQAWLDLRHARGPLLTYWRCWSAARLAPMAIGE